MDKNKELLQRLKKSVFVGLISSAVITLFMFLVLSTANIKRLAIVLAGAAAVIFILKIIYDIIIEKTGCKRNLLANILFALFAFTAFFATTVCAFASIMFFPNVNYEEYQQSLYNYIDTKQANLEEISIDTQSGVMSGWFLHNTDMTKKAPVVLYFGGNAECAAERINRLIENEEEMSVFSGCNFAFVDYPGYGQSEGSASEKSFKNFGLAAYDYMMSRDDVNGVIVMGYSIGTGVSNYVASLRQPMGLILMAPYATGYDLYNNYMNIFYGPVKTLVTFKMKSEKFASDVTVKPLILASKSDETVPYESSVRLFEKYKNGCNFVTIDDIGHNEFWDNKEVLMEISKYVNAVR